MEQQKLIKMNIYVDIDNTICETIGVEYEKATPIKHNIKKINLLYDKGNNITYWTARGTVSKKITMTLLTGNYHLGGVSSTN